MARQHEHDHHQDDRPSGQTRRSFLYSLSLAGVVALAGCGGGATATSAPQATTAAGGTTTGGTTTGGAAATWTTAATPGGATATRGTATTVAAGGATPLPSCILTPEETEGPYYFNANQVRRDITEGKPGTRLQLTITVVNVNAGCQPVRDAVVDIWHCDATGLYSGYSGQAPGRGEGSGGGTPPPGGRPGGPGVAAAPPPDVATAEKFLRGIQVTDASGQATFDTIFPGWYQGRLTHIHFKVHINERTAVTSQFFPSDDVTRQVYASDAPYTTRGQNPTTLANDGVVRTEAERAPLLMAARRDGAGIVGNFVVGLRL